MTVCAFSVAKPKSNEFVRPAPGNVYLAGHDAAIDAGLKKAGINAVGMEWWDVSHALLDAGDLANAGRAESLAIPF